MVVVEDCTDGACRRCQRVRTLLDETLNLALLKKVEEKRISRHMVRKFFSQAGAWTKYQIATVIAGQLPEIAPRLLPVRNLWMSEDSRMSIFDAAAFALTYYYLEAKRGNSS